MLLDNTTGAAFALFETLASLSLTYLYLRVETRNRSQYGSYARKRQHRPLFGRSWAGNILLVIYLLFGLAYGDRSVPSSTIPWWVRTASCP